MTDIKKIISILISVLLIFTCISICACSAFDKSKPFIGTWDIYKVSDSSSEIVFSDYANIVDMEMTIQFDENKTYTIHYYVNGKEGDKYPQYGTFTIDGDQLLLSNDGVAEIIDGELVLTIGNSKQYGKKIN